MASSGRTRTLTIPLIWTAAALLAGGSSWLLPSGPPPGANDPAAASYFLTVHLELWLFLAVFAILYFVLGRIRSLPYRIGLAYAHLILILLGVLVIVAPRMILSAFDVGDAQRTFETLNTLSSIGYALVLLSIVVFGALLAFMFLFPQSPVTTE